MARGETYEDFIKKFTQGNPKTTDDCYTPKEVWEVVASYVENKLGYNRVEFIRPFYPGGDYKQEDYSQGIVVDNPPFSIMAEILNFYDQLGVPYFLFCNGLTGFNNVFSKRVIHPRTLIQGERIVYENKAEVFTSFVTNVWPEEGTLFVNDPSLREDLYKIKKIKEPLKYDPREVNAARLRKYNSDFNIKWDEVEKTTTEVFGNGVWITQKKLEEIEEGGLFHE